MSNVTASQGMLLPEAKAQSKYKEALKIEILKDSILVDQKSVARLKNFEIQKASGSKSEEVYQALLNVRKRLKMEVADSHLLLLADKRTPYMTLKDVMNSAASAGFVDLQLAVVQSE